jgi:hypothetical protein
MPLPLYQRKILIGALLFCLLIITFCIRIQGVGHLSNLQFTGNDAYLYHWQAGIISEHGRLPARDRAKEVAEEAQETADEAKEVADLAQETADEAEADYKVAAGAYLEAVGTYLDAYKVYLDCKENCDSGTGDCG